jgi:hypothetical protein
VRWFDDEKEPAPLLKVCRLLLWVTSHLERKFVTLYDGSNLCRGERLWRMQVLEVGQSSRWC